MDVAPQLFGIQLVHQHGHESYWLQPGYTIQELLHEYCGMRPPEEWRWEEEGEGERGGREWRVGGEGERGGRGGWEEGEGRRGRRLGPVQIEQMKGR